MRSYPDPAARRLITIGCVVSTIIVALDGTIANVALPHMQSAMMASHEQIVWVLTSYIIASAIMTPLSGWLAQRFGRRRVVLVSIAGFTLTSVACGLSANLEELVLFRLLQGISGAGLVPLAQATLLDINPPEDHGKAMALFGMGTIVGSISGPTLGGWLTDVLSWHWIFLVNLPIGAVAMLVLISAMPETENENSRFDLTGFSFLAIAIASTQLMLDRGQQLDWFDSWEIRIEAGLAVTFAYLTVVHMVLSRDPFLKPALFKDRNFVLGSILSMVHGMVIFAVAALVAPMLQQLMGYSAMQTGLVTAPRSIGTMVGMFIAGRIVNSVDARWMVGFGMAVSAISLYMMALFSLEMSYVTFVVAGVVQGFGAGFVFVPLSTLLFSTLDPKLRNEGSALFSLTRMLGAAVGISYLQALTIRNSAAVHSRLTEYVRPDNPVLEIRHPGADFGLAEWIAGMDRTIAREAAMVAYVDSYLLLGIVVFAVVPLAFLMRPAAKH
jgi:DHA2 family multidrug resistance protein